MQKKNVAIMIHKMYGGGAEKVVADLSAYLSDEKYNKKVITYDSSNVGYSYEGEIIDLESKASANPLRKFINFIKRINKVKKIKRQKKIDTTISLLSGPNLVNLLSHKNDKVIISVRSFISSSPSNIYGRLHKFLIRNLYNRAHVIVAVSREIKNDLIDNFQINEDKIKVIYNFYDINKITKFSEVPVVENQDLFNSPTVITSGRLSQQKGQWHLIRAFKKVKEEVPDAKLIILGEGILKDYLTNLSRDLGIEHDIHFLGFQKNPFKYLSKADIFAFPSLYEGFPNAVCEAMACGLPVISSDCRSGPREILYEYPRNYNYTINAIEYADYGILVPTCDGRLYQAYEQLTREELLLGQAILDLFEANDKLRKYKELSRARVKIFNWHSIISQWENVIG